MKLSNLAAALRRHGLTVVETPGWAGRGFLGRDLLEVRGVLWHHTATNRGRFDGADAPTLQMCIDGRPDVAGPLCNIVFGRNGTVYLVAAGLANHAGAGELPNIPRDLGNYYLIGIEMESSGVAPWDWTADQLRVAPALGAALEIECLGWLPPELRIQAGHLEYSSGGKIDPAGWPGGMDGLRASINAVLGGGGAVLAPAGTTTQGEWDEMATKDEIREVVREESGNFWFTNAYGTPVQLWSILRAIDMNINGNNAATQAKLDRLVGENVGLRAAVAALTSGGGNVSAEQVESAIRDALDGFTLTLEPAKKEG